MYPVYCFWELYTVLHVPADGDLYLIVMLPSTGDRTVFMSGSSSSKDGGN